MNTFFTTTLQNSTCYQSNSIYNGEYHLCIKRWVHNTSTNCNRMHTKIMQVPLFKFLLIQSILFLFNFIIKNYYITNTFIRHNHFVILDIISYVVTFNWDLFYLVQSSEQMIWKYKREMILPTNLYLTM